MNVCSLLKACPLLKARSQHRVCSHLTETTRKKLRTAIVRADATHQTLEPYYAPICLWLRMPREERSKFLSWRAPRSFQE